jgi:hypothetical protein
MIAPYFCINFQYFSDPIEISVALLVISTTRIDFRVALKMLRNALLSEKNCATHQLDESHIKEAG